jgi:hypothetical protein
MSLIGHRTAIITLGLSCQPAQQLRDNADCLSAIANEKFHHWRLPFDWVISPIENTTEWIRSGPIFPRTPDDIRAYPYPGAFFWPERGLYFWHDFRSKDTNALDPVGTFEYTRGLYDHGFGKMRHLKNLDRIRFVVANTQNNLPTFLGEDFKGFDFTQERLLHLKASAERYIGKKGSLLAVTYEDRQTGITSSETDGISVVVIPKDESAWKGAPDVWREILTTYLRHLTSMPPELGDAQQQQTVATR